MIGEQEYPFAWLDEVVEITLNPERSEVKSIAETQLQSIIEKFKEEIRQVECSLKCQVFYLFNPTEIKPVVVRYYTAIQLLLEQAAANLEAYARSSFLFKTGETIVGLLERLASAMQKRYDSYLPEAVPAHKPKEIIVPVLLFKLLFALSADQLGILLRAAFELKLIAAKSLRQMYRIITPYLSTEEREVLSPESLRSNAGRSEKRDRDILINILQKLIDHIRGYR